MGEVRKWVEVTTTDRKQIPVSAFCDRCGRDIPYTNIPNTPPRPKGACIVRAEGGWRDGYFQDSPDDDANSLLCETCSKEFVEFMRWKFDSYGEWINPRYGPNRDPRYDSS